MTVGSHLRVEAVYLNTVQVASRAGIRFFATSEWVTLAPKLLTDSLALAEGLDEGVTLGGAFPSTFPSPTTLARGSCHCSRCCISGCAGRGAGFS